ncbi:MAG: alpha/beta fold hydrolase [Propionibacteriaceae bacterium]|nr:alpha/beta fold hydrolase [Propionibacteriaceae bacterium]
MDLNWTYYNANTSANRVLLLGPSLGGNAAHQWTKVAGELLSDTRVVFIDLPGTGLGEVWDDADEPSLDTIAAGIAAVAEQVREDVGVDVPLYFAGLSISGATALHLARDYDKIFAAVAVVASAATVGEPDRWAERAEAVEESGTSPLIEETTKRWFTPDFRAQQPAVVDTIMEGLAAADDHSYAQLCRALAKHNLIEDLPLIRIPVMLIAGERDTSTPIQNVELVAENVLRGALHVVEGAAHMVPVSHPVEVAGLLRSLMERPLASRVVSESGD